ncbi:MAG TPA: WYL domain-containing protein [Acidimicrobiia bacterium]
MRNVLERLINLLAMLLTSTRPVTADEIRKTIPGYSQDSDEAFHRMFERDKDLLRRIGIPLELRPTDGWEVEHGYVVDPVKYRLPDAGLTDEERAALFLAARMVRLGGEPAAPEAVLKLGGARLTDAVDPMSAELGAAAEVLAPLFAAVTDRHRISFDYPHATKTSSRRRMNPYGLGHRRGHWYVVGMTAEGERIYRVDRMRNIELEEPAGAFDRPTGFRITEALRSQPWEAGTDQITSAKVRFNRDIAWWAARQLDAKATKPAKDGSMTATVAVTNRPAFLGWVLSFGDGAEVLSPPELRRAVIDRVKGIA